MTAETVTIPQGSNRHAVAAQDSVIEVRPEISSAVVPPDDDVSPPSDQTCTNVLVASYNLTV